MQHFVNLFVPNQLYMFRAMFSPIIRSTWLYLQLLLSSTYVAEMELQFHLVHDTGRQQHGWTTSEGVNTVKCSGWWAKTSPGTCRADWLQINKPKVASCWSSITNYSNDARTHKHQNSQLIFFNYYGPIFLLAHAKQTLPVIVPSEGDSMKVWGARKFFFIRGVSIRRIKWVFYL